MKIDIDRWSLDQANREINSRDWSINADAGGISRQEALQWASHGAETLVAPSDKFMSDLENLMPETSRKTWSHDVYGAFPDVPRYLHGSDPRTMRRRTRVMEDHAPIRIYVELAASFGVSADQYIQRGSAVLSLLRIAESSRPVELYSILSSTAARDSLHNVEVITIRLPSAPLNVSLSAAWISHPAIFRKCLAGRPYRFNLSAYPINLSNNAAFRNLMGFGPSDIYIPGVHFDDPILSDPIAWIKARLAELNLGQDD